MPRYKLRDAASGATRVLNLDAAASYADLVASCGAGCTLSTGHPPVTLACAAPATTPAPAVVPSGSLITAEPGEAPPPPPEASAVEAPAPPALKTPRAVAYAPSAPRAGTGTSSNNTKHLSQDISDALSERRWTEAAELLSKLSQTTASNVKLGSLQRWTRDADACVDDDKGTWRALLWLLCRVAAGQAADVPKDVPMRRSVFACLPRAEAGDPTPAHESGKRPAYVCSREKGPQRTPPNNFDLTVWAQTDSVLDGAAAATRIDVPAAPGVFLVRDVFSPTECGRLLALASTLGYERDEPLDASQRRRLAEKTTSAFACLDDDSDSTEEEAEAPSTDTLLTDHSLRSRACVCVVSELTHNAVFERLRAHLPAELDYCCDARGRRRGVGQLVGLNRRWRFYRYDAGGTYRPHVDGAWPGSGVGGSRDRPKYEYDAFGDRLSRLTMLIYLNDDFEGGETAFYSAGDDTIDVTAVQPLRGAVLFFPHGETTGSLIHEGSSVSARLKYVVRTEVLYTYPTAAAPPRVPSGAPKKKGGRRRRP